MQTNPGLAPNVPDRHPCQFRAFVVGNNKYKHLTPLQKCVNDASTMGAMLQRKGYVATVLEDAGVELFAHEFETFAASLSSGSTVVVHFSGHGTLAGGSNRFVFVDQTTRDAEAGKIDS